ncbi:MAG: hopanoid biosynthesis associated radical SAM protein HpnJ [Candidatus Kuenenia stuttgartiensis]|nr:hopanoid biosynthesis associated radical SAM protein HpnJ [Candidatus Kuenenia stuttgartiensis]MCL4726942.1 hopanoid biosynthesis associated radical SAM protein HpnJ [Candidatus Kuenenia stuttgartiensis]GJQ50015.1 MAG: hopanoid biosynthesis associated radical SAM protein HpnJ [Candidatus Kuenenia stuttgartiensis]
MMKKTLLLNPPCFDQFDGGAGSRYQARREVRSFWYPTWLCYTAGLIPGSKVVDAPAQGLQIDEVVSLAGDYELVVMYTNTPTLSIDRETAKKIKAVNPESVICFVGPHVTIQPEDALREDRIVDIVARGEFDITVKELAEGKALQEVKGISYLNGSGVVHNADRGFTTDLDSLPFVTEIYERDLNYKDYEIPYLRYPYLSIYSGRGCPSQCIYCLWPQTMMGHQYRVRSVDNVIRELMYCKERFPEVKEIFFDDDTFTANRKRVQEFSRKVKDLGITWSATSRANLDRETLQQMKEGGLRLLVVGYESGNDEILKNVKKGITIDQAKRFTGECKSLGIQIHGTFMLGLPGENRSSMEDTIRFAIEMDPDTMQVSIASPYPGTEFYDYCEKNGYLKTGTMLSSSGHQLCNIEYPDLPAEEIILWTEKFYKKFYFRPRIILRIVKKMLQDPVERKRRLREGRQFFKTMRSRRKYTKKSC